jgi:hypothetical protein
MRVSKQEVGKRNVSSEIGRGDRSGGAFSIRLLECFLLAGESKACVLRASRQGAYILYHPVQAEVNMIEVLVDCSDEGY